MKEIREGRPAYLMVAQNEPSQRHAAAALVRPDEVRGIARALARWGGGDRPAGDLIAAWLRWLRYFDDPPFMDIWRAPSATLALGGGDCEDLTIVALSLLLALGGSGVLVIGIYYSRTGPIGHAWMEGWDGGGWLHLDATNRVLTRGARPMTYLPMVAYAPGPEHSRGGPD